MHGQRVEVLSERAREHGGILWHEHDTVSERAQRHARDVLAVDQNATRADRGRAGAGQ